MNFSEALIELKTEHKLQRAGWNGKDQWVVLMPPLHLPSKNSGLPIRVNERTAKHLVDDAELDSQPYFALKNVQGKWQPGWVPSTGDLLAEDWQVAQ